ncbi:MAG: fatty acid desaturase [Fluviicoccus sp.]|uniref:fatty acid desaturase n=1 Tax=Fluviicoccus sp. TaxID=2003552 RepID=UPI0027278B51|nr:fatty acid desaturase [Fluviicoccus sp.]MDO8331965.1 fatty acid desaturase [Fluviicoccus sp.]
MGSITAAAAIEQAGAATLAEDLQALYDEARARMGDEDLAHIRKVAAYSRAIKARSRELIQKGGKPDALKRGIALYMMHVLLEFSELGHNIMHGSFDNLPGVGEFHSDKWQWDFVTDVREWKVMHHQNHHPFTNIVGKDHDLGYSFVRLYPTQNWYGHHAVQPAVLAVLLFHVYHFSLYTATSAARVEGRKVLSLDTFRATFDRVKKHALQNYLKEPLEAGPRFLQTLVGNYLGTALGYDLTFLILALEHHSPNVEVFPDPGPTETRDGYFRRQLLGTTNFVPMPELDSFFERILAEEVDFPDRPSFEVFYGGLTTHIEHHLFPDLPCNRQREIAPKVRELCAKHGLPYNVTTFEVIVPEILRNFFRWAMPVTAAEQDRPSLLLKKPRELVSRVLNGLRYRSPTPTTYFKAPGYFNVPAKVLAATPAAGGQALTLTLEKPFGWDEVHWDAGAFISVRVPVDGEDLVRQYSLTTDSRGGNTLDITVKRVQGGRVSNAINDRVRKGSYLTLVGGPQSDGSFIMKALPQRPVFIAGGVGITPIISMIRKLHREAPNTEATLLYFNRDPASIIFEQELRVLEMQTGLKLHLICDQAPASRRELVQARLSQALLEECIGSLAEADIYVCAPPGMIGAVQGHLLAMGLPEARFHTESFTLPTLVRPKSDGRQHSIHFVRSGLKVTVDGATTLLEASRQAGIHVPTGCERGLCKACVCTKINGVTQEDAQADIPLVRITMCNSLPRSDVELDI